MSDPIPVGSVPNVFNFQGNCDDEIHVLVQTPQSISSTPKLSSSAVGASLAEKRANHNAIERARRELFNVRFQSLAAEIPQLAANRKPSKSLIVQKATEYIQELHKRSMKQDRMVQFYRAKSEGLREEVNRLRQAMGMPLMPEIDERSLLQELEVGCSPPVAPHIAAKVSALSQALHQNMFAYSPSFTNMDPEEEEGAEDISTPQIKQASVDEVMIKREDKSFDQVLEEEMSKSFNVRDDTLLHTLFHGHPGLPRLNTHNLVPSTPINTPLTGSSMSVSFQQQQALMHHLQNLNLMQGRSMSMNDVAHSLPSHF